MRRQACPASREVDDAIRGSLGYGSRTILNLRPSTLDTHSLDRMDLHRRGGARRGFTARALGVSIFAEADTWGELQAQVRDAVIRHLDDGQAPRVVRLHFVREEVFA